MVASAAEMPDVPRPFLGWRIGSSAKLYGRQLGAYERIARRMFNERYLGGGTNKRFRARYQEWLRVVSPTDVEGPQLENSFRGYWTIKQEVVDRTIQRLARFLLHIDKRRGLSAALCYMSNDERSREMQRLELMATEIMERLRAMERGE